MLAIAHRTPSTAPECARLAGLGVTHFEVDLQFVAGAPVVSHYLPPLAALPRLRHDGWRFTLRARTAAEQDLAAVLDRVPAECGVLVDLKSEDPDSARALVELLRDSGRPAGGWYVSAKSVDALAVVIAAGYPGWLSVDTRPAFVAALNGQLPPGLDAVTVRHTFLDGNAVARIQAHQPRVLAWTVNKTWRLQELAGYGITGVTSDDPDVLAAAATR